MPTLKRKKTYKREKNKFKKNYYLSKRWILLRDEKRLNNPLCEVCLFRGRTKAMGEVHHIIPIATGMSEVGKEALAYDRNNLISLCYECHDEVHLMLKKEPAAYWQLVRDIEESKGS